MKEIMTTLVSASLLLFSCSKQKDLPSDGNTGTSAKKLVQSTINNLNALYYNPDGTIKQIDRTISSEIYSKHFTYSNSKVSYIGYLKTIKAETGEYSLVNGKIVAFDWITHDAFGLPITSYHETFTYNSRGLLDKHMFDNGNYAVLEYDEKDNLVKSTYFESGQASKITEYTYTSIPDKFHWFGFFDCYGEGFFKPAYAKFLPASEKITKLSTGEVTYFVTFTYELDSQGYMVKASADQHIAGYPSYQWTNVFQ